MYAIVWAEEGYMKDVISGSTGELKGNITAEDFTAKMRSDYTGDKQVTLSGCLELGNASAK